MSSVWNSFVVWQNYWMCHIRQFRQLSWLQLKQSSCCWSENCTWWRHYLIPQATHIVQFLVWEHRHPVCGEGVMVREAFRKYCKKSETIDHVKIYKCCRENYKTDTNSKKTQNTQYEDWMSNWALKQTSSKYGIRKQGSF